MPGQAADQSALGDAPRTPRIVGREAGRGRRAPISAVMPKTTKKKPPALAMYTGVSG